MELVERESLLESLQLQFERVTSGEGHCVLVNGEAGMGKTSLVLAFCDRVKYRCDIFQGTCDALFTPRPLAPLFDILLQLGSDVYEYNSKISDRSVFFANAFREFYERPRPSIVIFEDIHWADEATLDFIKFFARRIRRLQCLFILTYRDNEIHARHPLRNIVGQLSPATFNRLSLPPLSRQAVEKLAAEKGYNGDDVYNISGGNPFYVQEILASYSTGVPENIRDSILSGYNRLDEKTRQIWELLSVLPVGFELIYLEAVEPEYARAIENCLASKILVIEKGQIFFKHDLYRRTIEESLSPLLRIGLNKKILVLFRSEFEKANQVEWIIHHAKNANDNELVVQYAPIAARQAAAVGAHIEAAKLFLSAIEYYPGNDPDVLLEFYEAYAYECYLTNQASEAIIYSQKALEIWNRKRDPERIANCLRFLSRLWWWNGNWDRAESFGQEAIKILETAPASKAKAMAFSNMSQLQMLRDRQAECLYWGEKAIAMASELEDKETLAHALNNVGSARMANLNTSEMGAGLLRQSLDLALDNGFTEHAARAFTNLACNYISNKNYTNAIPILEEGIRYCEERDLDAWASYMLSWRARLLLETGDWNEAHNIADSLGQNESKSPIVRINALTVLAKIHLRRGDEDSLSLLQEAKSLAVDTRERQRLLPVFCALLEYEWLYEVSVLNDEQLATAKNWIAETDNEFEAGELSYWINRSGGKITPSRPIPDGYRIEKGQDTSGLAEYWEKKSCPYERALVLSVGNEDQQREAITILTGLGAAAVCKKLKFEMRSSGIQKIPRGARKTTQSNPAWLTSRELEVLKFLKEGLQNKEIASRMFISAKTVDHHITSIFYKLEVNTRAKAVNEAQRLEIIK
jgi:DNA-binding CsgD family transcriptional regulator